MWCEPGPPPASLPAVLAVPWVAVARRLGMPPVLTYSTYNLYNWRRLDPAAPVRLGNIVCLHVGWAGWVWSGLYAEGQLGGGYPCICRLSTVQPEVLQITIRQLCDGVLCCLVSVAVTQIQVACRLHARSCSLTQLDHA